MNFVALSPHFPPNYSPFRIRLNELGVDVLGLADAPYDALRPELRRALAEYYRVDDMRDCDRLLRAPGHFTHRHGRIDRIDSHNELWLEAEAALRTDFNIPGIWSEAIAAIRRKSLIKEIYREWASVVVRNRFEASWSRPFHCGYFGRKYGKRYARSHAEILDAFGRLIVHHTPMESIFRDAIGDCGYLVRSPDLDEVLAAARFIHELA